MPFVIYDPIGLARGASGGALLGLVAALLMAYTGQTLGFSGIVGGVVREGFPGQQPWRLAFLIGALVAGGILTGALGPPGSVASVAVFGEPEPIHWLVSLIGGLLVGVGTRLGNGCTSGHGVCGIPRGSPRSLAAVGTFMAVAALVAGLSRAPFSRPSLYSASANTLPGGLYILPMIGAVLLSILLPFIESMIYLSPKARALVVSSSTSSSSTLREPPVSPTAATPSAVSTESLLQAIDSTSGGDNNSDVRLRGGVGSPSPLSLSSLSQVDDKNKDSSTETETTSMSNTTDAASTPSKTVLAAPASLFLRSVVLFGVFLGGLISGLALALSGMAEPEKVFRFLDFTGEEGWDPQLAFVMGGAVATNGIAVYLLAFTTRSNSSPALYSSTLSGGYSPKPSPPKFSELLPVAFATPNVKIDAQLLLGAAMFGAGWGLAGVCPGPAIVNFASGTSSHVAITSAGVVAGMALFEARMRYLK